MVLGACIAVGLLALAVRLYRLQITRGDEFVQKSVANALKEVRIPADRGMILDARKDVLVDNRPSFDLQITPAFCLHCKEEVIPQLASYLGWDATQVLKAEAQLKAVKREAIFQPVTVWIDLTKDDPERVKLDTLNAHKMDLPGVDVVQAPHRNYRTIFLDHDGKPSNGLAPLIGYMQEINESEFDHLNADGAGYQLGDYVGRIGIEKAFESSLRGEDGKREEVVDARGEPLPMLNGLLVASSTVEPVPGHNVILSIDARLQEEAEHAFKGTAGAVVAVDVHTGFIKAMMSRPAFDPNLMTGRVSRAQLEAMSKDPLLPMIFRAVQQQYAPGSTFKPIAMLAALRSGQYTEHSTYTCTGGYRLGNRTWRCFVDRGHGHLDIKHAIQASCDAFFYHLGDVVGLDVMANMALDLGLGQPTGIGVVQEVPGIMPTVAYYDRVAGGYQRYMALNSAIGQGDDNVTPIQLVYAYATIANGGTLYQPQVVQRVESQDGEVLETFAPKVVRKIDLDPDQRKLVIEGLAAVVNEPGGTAYGHGLKKIKMAGKTGTAQVKRIGTEHHVKKDTLSYFERDNAWFVGFAPAEDPEIAVVALTEHAGFGGTESAPVVAAVIQKYFDLKDEDSGVTATADASHVARPVAPHAPVPDVPKPTAPPPAPHQGSAHDPSDAPRSGPPTDSSAAKPPEPPAEEVADPATAPPGSVPPPETAEVPPPPPAKTLPPPSEPERAGPEEGERKPMATPPPPPPEEAH
jgi:penicillin-binding protein 2